MIVLLARCLLVDTEVPAVQAGFTSTQFVARCALPQWSVRESVFRLAQKHRGATRCKAESNAGRQDGKLTAHGLEVFHIVHTELVPSHSRGPLQLNLQSTQKVNYSPVFAGLACWLQAQCVQNKLAFLLRLRMQEQTDGALTTASLRVQVQWMRYSPCARWWCRRTGRASCSSRDH